MSQKSFSTARQANSRKNKSRRQSVGTSELRLPNLVLIFQTAQAHAFSHPAESTDPGKAIKSMKAHLMMPLPRRSMPFVSMTMSSQVPQKTVQWYKPSLGHIAHIFVLVLCDPL